MSHKFQKGQVMETYGLKKSASVRHNLPAQPTLLIGRERDMAAARERLLQTEVRLLTFTGPGGVGKTRLALATAAEFIDEFGDGVVLVDLSPLGDPTLIPSVILRSLDLQVPSTEAPSKTLIQVLRHRHQLILIDNFEHLLVAAPLLAELLAACPMLKLLVTSRIPLHLR